jgi:hypothetical protein
MEGNTLGRDFYCDSFRVTLALVATVHTSRLIVHDPVVLGPWGSHFVVDARLEPTFYP